MLASQLWPKIAEGTCAAQPESSTAPASRCDVPASSVPVVLLPLVTPSPLLDAAPALAPEEPVIEAIVPLETCPVDALPAVALPLFEVAAPEVVVSPLPLLELPLSSEPLLPVVGSPLLD